MSDNNDNELDLDRIRQLPIRSEEIGLPAEALVACTKCGRSNARSRAACIYCGTRLEGSSAEEKLDTFELENWEKGFNVVLLGNDVRDVKSAVRMLASLFGTEAGVFESIIESRQPLPLARLRSEDHAAAIVDKLEGFGVKATVVSDEILSPTSPPIRLRGLEFGSHELVLHLFGGGESRHVPSSDLTTFVAGQLCGSKTELVEQKKRKEMKTVSETNLSSDDPVLDIYTDADPIGYRVPPTGFDFSCLGQEKSLLVGENMLSLVSKLEMFAPAARVVRDYAAVRSMLEYCWPNESRKDRLETRTSALRPNNTSTIFTTNNSLQLLKYSRLQSRLR